MIAEVRPIKVTEKLPGLVDKYWQDVWASKKDGKLVAWCSGRFPFHLLRDLGITTVWPEGYGITCGAAGVSTDLCQRAEAAGYSPDLCSVVRTFIGGSLSNQQSEVSVALPYGGFPQPDLLFCYTYCPGIYKMWEEYSRVYNVPLWVVEEPYLNDALGKEEISYHINNVMEELQAVIKDVEKLTGRRLDYDRVSESLVLEREAGRLWWDCLEMSKNIPAPFSVFDAQTHMFPYYMQRGRIEAVDYYKELKAELTDRTAHNIMTMVPEEKYRLYWDNLPIYHKIEDHIKKFASYGAVPVVAQYSFFFGFFPDSDPEKNPLKTSVELLMLNPFNRGLKGKIDSIARLVEDYKVDGLVMQRSRTCQRVNIGQDDIIEALTKKTGLPVVIIEGDNCDTRLYSDSEFNSKIDAFMEILEQRGSKGGTNG